MDEKELNLLLGKVSDQAKEAVKTELKDALSGLMKTDELAAKLEAVGITGKAIADLTKAVEEQGVEMRKLFETGPKSVKSLSEILEEKKTLIMGLATGAEKAISISIPVKTLVQTSLVGSSTIGQRLPDIGQIAVGGAVMRALFGPGKPVEAGMNKTVRYIDRTTSTNSAAGRLETGTFAESALAWTEYSFAVPEIADSIPVTKESFRFISFIQSEVERLLSINMTQKEDAYFWDGTGTPPISKGVYTYATDFDYATYIATAGSWLPEKANLYDLALILKEQISNGKESKYLPNLVIVNPGNSIQMLGTKNANGDYIKHPLMNGNVLDGMEVVQSSQVDKNTMLVCDRRFATIYDAEDLVIEMGYVGDQFKEGKMTLRAYKSTGILVRNSDAGAFLKVTNITDALTAINAVTA